MTLKLVCFVLLRMGDWDNVLNAFFLRVIKNSDVVESVLVLTVLQKITDVPEMNLSSLSVRKKVGGWSQLQGQP